MFNDVSCSHKDVKNSDLVNLQKLKYFKLTRVQFVRHHYSITYHP